MKYSDLIKFPGSLKQHFIYNKRINHRLVHILRAYGPLMWSSSSRSIMLPAEILSRRKVLRCGDVICTSGGVPHYGPSSNTFRVVLFGAVAPIEKKLYEVDNQFFSLSAFLFVIQCAWDDSDYSSKKWLLFHLIKMVSDHGGRSCTTIDCNLCVSRYIT